MMKAEDVQQRKSLFLFWGCISTVLAGIYMEARDAQLLAILHEHACVPPAVGRFSSSTSSHYAPPKYIVFSAPAACQVFAGYRTRCPGWRRR